MYIASQSHVSKVKKRYLTIFCPHIFSKTAHSEVLNFGTFSWHFSKHIKVSSVAPQRLAHCLSCNFQCRYSVSCVKNRIFAVAIGSEWIRWKGNRVQIPNSPAAVSSRFLDITSCCHWHFFGKASVCPAASQKTCRCYSLLLCFAESQ